MHVRGMWLQVMYDASGVRLHAGKQATVLNIIISQLPADHPGSGETPLRDRLGHTPRQVQLPKCNSVPACLAYQFVASVQWNFDKDYLVVLGVMSCLSMLSSAWASITCDMEQ